jgi:Werner syndrome ATP-dependent helicase
MSLAGDDVFGDDAEDSWMAEVADHDESATSHKEAIAETKEENVFGDEDDSWIEEAAASIDDESNEQVVSTPATEEHLAVLSSKFGHKEFKPIQWEIIRSVMSEKVDQCVVMATGYGKSLLYQFPPVYLGQTSLVVSPLIALMEDQVLGLQVLNIEARFLGSGQSDKRSAYDDIRTGKVRVVYVTPEFVDSATETLLSLLPEERLALIAIDEAHCVSQVLILT